MLKLLSFELKKIFKKNKLIYLLLIIIVFSVYHYSNHVSQKDEMVERLYEETEPLQVAVGPIIRDLDEKRVSDQLDERGLEQLNDLKNMQEALYEWRSAIHLEEFYQAPISEQEFLNSLQDYLNVGGEFTALDGINLEYALHKNTWMVEHDLAVEDESYPLSPHLFLKHISDWFFEILGIMILLLILGNILSAEKEEKTWLTLKTQPITKANIIFTKYLALLLGLFVYICLIILIGILIPMIFSDHQLILNYPQVLMIGNEITVISMLHYLILKTVGFIGAGLIAYGLLLFISMLLKSTFSSLMFSFFVLLIGYYLTDSIPALQTSMNLFQHLRLDQPILDIDKSIAWEYPLFAVLWGTIFIVGTIFLPEKNGELIKFTTVRKPFQAGQTSPKRNRLWNVIIFEFRKLFRKGHMAQVLTILLLLIIIGYSFLHQAGINKETEYFTQLNQEVNMIKNEFIPRSEESIANDTEELEQTNDESQQELIQDYIEGSKEFIRLYQDRIDKINDGIKGYRLGNWIPFYDQQLFLIQLLNGDFDNALHFISHNSENLLQFQYEVSVEEKKWLMEKDVQPLFSGELRLTMHDEVEVNPSWIERNQKVNASGLYSLFHFYEYYLYFVPLVLFLFLLGAGIASEKGKRNTIYFLQTQPISRNTLFLGKVMSSSFVVIGSLLGIIFFILLVGTIFNRFGDWHYPVLHYDPLSISTAANYTGIITDYYDYGFHFISLGNYLIQCLVLLLLLALFIIVIANLISLFVNNAFTVIFLAIVIMVGGYFASVEYLGEWSYLSPFIYFDILKVSNGEMATLLDQSFVNVYMGYIVLFISTLLLVMLGCFKEKRNH